MKTVDEIMAAYTERRNNRHPIIAEMEAVRDAYNGDIAVPLPELGKDEKAAVANLVQMGLDQGARRIASVMPTVYYPPVNELLKGSRDRAELRRKATLGWWAGAEMPLKLGQRARWLLGYACSPVIIRPDPRTGTPKWELRDPLAAYPCPTDSPTDFCPRDVIFAYQRTWRWAKDKYGPRADALLPALRSSTPKGSDKFYFIEYQDDQETVLLALGKTPTATRAVELDRVVNRAGMCLTVMPGRITLDRPMGQFAGMLGMYRTQARLTALELIAVEKGVFPDLWAVSRQNETVKFISGPHAPGSGMVNQIAGGDVKEIRTPPDFMTNQTIDRLERSMRVTGGIPAEYSGESPTNVRTDRRGNTVMSAVVDPMVQEAQLILATSLEHENRRAVAVAKAYFGNQTKSFYVSWKGAKGNVDYIPDRDFETDHNVVSYSHPGADVNGLAIAGGQRIGLGTMSKRTFMELDPLVDDPELEHDRFIAEGLEQALMASVQQQATAGNIPPADVARLMELVVSNKMELPAAIQKVQKEAQDRQAQQAPPGSPATQPGIAVPGAGAEAGTAAIQGPSDSTANLSQLLGALRRPQMTVPSERTAANA